MTNLQPQNDPPQTEPLSAANPPHPLLKNFSPEEQKDFDHAINEGETRAYVRSVANKTGGIPTQFEGLFDNVIGADQMPVGDVWYASLDDAGAITGVYEFIPNVEDQVKWIRVRKQYAAEGSGYHALVTESGAELIPPLNPGVDNRWMPSSPEAYAESAAKTSDHREARRRHTGTSNLPHGNPQTDRPDYLPTDSRNRGQVQGAILVTKSDDERAAVAKAEREQENKAGKTAFDERTKVEAKQAEEAKAKADKAEEDKNKPKK